MSSLSAGATMVANRLHKNLRRLAPWCKRQSVSCYRVYDADIPEYAAAVDLYQEEGSRAIKLHVQEYQAPASIPKEIAAERLSELIAAVAEVFVVAEEAIAIKTRLRAKGGSQYGALERTRDAFVVREGAALLSVDLHAYLDTGLFLDHRPMRRRIAQMASGQRFLNLFSYTGSFSVQAGLGGAVSSTSVDLSATYLDWAARNFERNNLDPQRHRLVRADALEFLRNASKKAFDLIFCDPPTFSNSKMADDFDVQRHHLELIRGCLSCLAAQGTLFFSTNYRRFRLDEAALAPLATIREISTETIDPDFARNPKIHRVWQLQRR